MKIRKVINHGNVRYRVTANLDGNRTQRFFPSKRKAKAWMAQVNRLDPLLAFWESLPDDDRRQLSLIHQTGNRLGIDLNTILQSLGNLARTKPKSRGLKDAVDHYLNLRASQNLRKSSYAQICLNLNQMVSRFSPIRCDQISSSMIENWFLGNKWQRSTIDGVIAKIGPFFSWCVREGYCQINPCGAVKRPRSDDSPPSIFTPPETKKLLQAALSYDPGLIPYLAIGLFAGVRPLEIERLTWLDISKRYVEINAAKAKSRKRRLVNLSTNLKEWLAFGGNLPLTNKRKRLAKILRLTGINWQPDIMRHSFASYHLALHQSADKTAFELGHRDSKMLFAHYRELVSFEAAKAYWNITPCKANQTG